MYKKLISVILAAMMVFSSLPAAMAVSSDSEIIVNEVFDDYVTYGPPADISVDGMDACVVEYDTKNKALYGKLWAMGFVTEIPLPQKADKMVYSFDLKVDGARVAGSALNISTSQSFFNFNADGSITLDNGYTVGGYTDKKWHNYTVAINYIKKTYDLYFDGKNILKGRKCYTSPSVQETMKFMLVPADDDKMAEVYIDNVRVYTGMNVLPNKAFAKKTYNPDALEFNPTTQKPANDTIFINSSGKNGLGTSVIEFQQKAETQVGWASLEKDGPQYVRIQQLGKTDCFFNLKVNVSSSYNTVFETDLYLKSMETTTVDLFRTQGDGYSNLLTLSGSGTLTCNSTTITKLPIGEWKNIAIVCDFISGTGDVYIDRQLVKENVALHSGGVLGNSIRTACRSITKAGNNEFYMNNIKVYQGKELRELPPPEGEEEVTVAPSVNTLNLNSQISRTSGKSTIGNDAVFMTNNDYYFLDGKKQKYSDFGSAAYEDENGVKMVPSELISKAFGVPIVTKNDSVVYGSETVKIGSVTTSAGDTLDAAPVEKDGVVYLPVASYVSKVLSKYAYDDGRGFVLLSQSNRKLKDDPATNVNTEDSDKIYRYMQFDRPTGDEIYDAVVSNSKGQHPRMFIHADEIPALRAKVAANDELKTAYANLLKKCEGYMNEDGVEYKKTLFRLIEPCEEVRTRIMDLAVANLVSGDKKYLDRMWFEVKNAFSWPDWNVQGHYLDTGMISPGMAIAYDMLYDYLDEDERQYFRDQMEKFFFDPAISTYTGGNLASYSAIGFRQTSSNWGAVVGGGHVMCALSFIDSEPEDSEFTQKCKFLAENSLQAIEYPIGMLYPDGSIMEGVGYWTFYIESLGWVFQSLMSSCGDDFGLLDAPGISLAPACQLYIQGSLGYYAYSSSGNTNGVGYHMVCDESYLISKLYGNIEEMNAARAFAASFGSKLGALGILWYEPLGDSNAYKSYPLDYVLKSIQLVSAKATWGEPNSAYFSAIGGAIELSSSHWDKGSFIFDDDGVRWFSDMGAEAYELADGSSHYGAAGAYIFRKRAEGHNCLLINPSAEDPGQVTGAYAALSRFETKPRGVIAEYDLAEVYGDKVTSYKRGFLFGDNRNSLVVQDEVELSKPNSEIYHYLYTTGKVEVSPDKKTAYITEDGKTLKIEYICDASSWYVEAQAANSLFPELHKAGEHSRASYTRVALVGKASGKLNISIKCTVEDELETYEPHRLVPMSQWTLPDGEIPPKPEIDAIYVNGEPLADFEPLRSDYSISLTADTPIPVFTATSTTGTVEVIAPETLNDYARFVVSNEHGKRAYRIKFNFIIREIENLMDTKPIDGIPADVKKLKVAYCYADHNPQTDNSDKNAVDDNLETRWSSDVKPSFIEVDVGEVTNISGVALAYMDSQRFYKYDILVSKDKINYEKIYTGTSSGLKNEWDYLPLGVDARYVRYVGYGHADGEWNSILEFRPCGKQ